jgi:2-dehydropantoate 2-reductase
MKPEILLIGTGAIGSFYAGKLWQAGAQVSTLCRSDYEQVRNKGITIKSIDGDFHFHPHSVIRNISEYSGRPDFIIVATKVLPGIDIPSLIGRNIDPSTSIVLIQNGIDVEKPVAVAFPENEIISALAFICASREEYGLINHQDFGRLVIGRYPSGISGKVRILRDLFTEAGVKCDADDDIRTARWKKLIWNAPFNPMSVLTGGGSTYEMMNSESTLKVVREVMSEVVRLAGALGHHIPETFITKNLEDTAVMKPYKTSMLLDYERKQPMEVEPILGTPVRLAREKGVDVPHMETLYGLLSLIDRKNTGR